MTIDFSFSFRPSYYVLHCLVDDYGNLLQVCKMSYNSYMSRYNYFNEE